MYKKLKKFDDDLMNVVLLQNLTPIQKQYLVDQHRFTLNPSGRRSRKTLLGMRKGVVWSLKEPGVYLFGAPTQEQAFEIFFDSLFKMTSLLNIQLDFKLAPKPKIYVPTMTGEVSTLKIIGLDKPSRAEGSQVRFLHATEVPDITDKNWWDEHVRPMFSDEVAVGQRRAILDGVFDYTKPYWSDMIEDHCGGNVGIPEKDKPFCMEDPNDPEWITYDWHSEDVLSPDEIDKVKKSTTKKIYRQEYGGQIITSGGLVYYAYSKDNDCKIKFDPSRETYLTFDFNVNPFTCSVWQRLTINEVDAKACVHEFAFWDTEGNAKTATPQIIKWLKDQNFNPVKRQLWITGDDAGNSRNHAVSETTWTVIEQTFKDYQMKAYVVTERTGAGGLRDGQETVNIHFSPMIGKPKYYINADLCPQLHADLKRLKQKRNMQQDDESGKRGHFSDGVRYLAKNFDEITLKYGA